jgi:hypothetical protein
VGLGLRSGRRARLVNCPSDENCLYPEICERVKDPVKLLAYLTELFIDTFGITRPRPEQQRTANLVIGGFLLVFGFVVLCVMGFLVIEISTGSHGH